MRGAQTGLLIVAGFIAIIIGIIISMMDGCLTLHESGCCSLSQKRFECFTSWKGKKDCIDLTLKSINAAFLIWAVVVSGQTKGFFSKLATDLCFTVDLNALVSDFAAQVNDFVYKKNLNALISFLVAVLVTIIKMILPKKKPEAATNPANQGNPVPNPGSGTTISNNDMKPGQVLPMDNQLQYTPNPS